MTDKPDQCCETMAWAISDDEFPVFYQPRWRSWVIEYSDGINTRRAIGFCPWCGAELRAELGDEWLQEVLRRGLDPATTDDDLPTDLLDDRWWKALNL